MSLARQNVCRAIATMTLVAMCAGTAFAATTPTQNVPATTAVAAAGAGPQEVAQANPFSDVPPNSWAYQAIAKLASEGLIKGYPDGQFKGQRPITRYEAAVLVNRVVDYLEAKISAGQKVSADDMATVKALVDQFRPELAAVQAHLKDLDTQVAALSTQVKANTSALDRQQFHLSLFMRPGVYQANISAFTNALGTAVAPGCAAAPCATKPNTALVYGSSPGGGDGGQNKPVSGQNTFGTAWMDLRLNYNGNIDARWSYATRLELKYYAENAALPTGSAATTPNFCPSAVSSAVPAGGGTPTISCPSDYPYGTTRVDIAALKYNDPSGVRFQIGKILPLYGNDIGGQAPSLILSDYFTGAELGYTKKNGLDASVGYFFWFPGASSTNGTTSLNNNQNSTTGGAGLGPGQTGTAQTSQDIWANAAYTFIPNHLNVGAAYLAQNGYTETLWNPAARTGLPAGVSGLYQAATVPIITGSVFGTYKFNGPIWLQAELAHRFGNDPFTGATWSQPNGVWAVATVGNYAGPTGTLWGEAGYIGTGFNGWSPESNIVSTTGYNQLYLSNPGGYQIYYVGGHWKVAPTVDFSVVYQHYQLLPGINLPAGSAACPGCYITSDTRSMVFADLWANF